MAKITEWTWKPKGKPSNSGSAGNGPGSGGGGRSANLSIVNVMVKNTKHEPLDYFTSDKVIKMKCTGGEVESTINNGEMKFKKLDDEPTTLTINDGEMDYTYDDVETLIITSDGEVE